MKKRLGRWLAVTMALTLLVGRCRIPVLAEENTESGQGSSVSDNDIGDDVLQPDEDDQDAAEETPQPKDENPGGEDMAAGTVLGNGDDINESKASEQIALVSTSERIETYAIEDTFTENIFEYTIIGDAEVSVKGTVEGRGTEGIIEIPPTVIIGGQSYVVTQLGYEAFSEYGEMTNIVIPDSVTDIGALAFIRCRKLTNIVIPPKVTSIKDSTYALCDSLTEIEIPSNINTIGGYAFSTCKELTSVKIQDGLTYIGGFAFSNCSKLKEVILPDSVQTVYNQIFEGCTSLKSVRLPLSLKILSGGMFTDCSSLESIEIPESVVSSGVDAFQGCSRLKNIKLPNNMRTLGGGTFRECSNLESVQIPSDIAIVYGGVFKNCQKLSELKVVVHDSDPIATIPILYADIFDNCPNERKITFVSLNGEKLSGQRFNDARMAYAMVDDGGVCDDSWYGWKLDDPVSLTYKVTVCVFKDGVEWPNHGKTFALLANCGSEFLYDLEHIPDGIYRIYDVTGVRKDSLWSKAADTGVSVRVNGADTEVDVTLDGADEEATVDYYTVTFYDEDDPYGADTDQRQQVVLKGKAAVRPNDPGKADHVFKGWVTAKDGSTPFDFMNTRIGDTTGIYASWRIADTATDIIIEASASEGGSISPTGSVSVERGTDKTFTIMPNDGYRIKSVSADGQEVTTEGEGTSRTYTFRNVTENHAIHATFEKNSGDDDGDNKPDGGAENNTAVVTTDSSASDPATATNTSNPAASSARQGKEPKTGDTAHTEMYATVAMIAGFAYILLYFMYADRGMTEREKEVFVAAFIRWAKRGSGIRKYFALAAIFCLLVYYHGIGKRVRADWKEVYVK